MEAPPPSSDAITSASAELLASSTSTTSPAKVSVPPIIAETPEWKKKKKPISEYAESQVLRDVPNWLCEDYHAAGVLVYACEASSASSSDAYGTQFLLCYEKRARDEHAYWNAFGGKRDLVDNNSPANTALREFQEETGGVFGSDFQAKLATKLLEPNCPKVWHRDGKYCLFFCEMEFVDTVMLKFAQMKLTSKELSLEDKNCPAIEVKWIAAPSLYEAIGKVYTGRIASPVERVELTPFFKQALKVSRVITLLNQICNVQPPTTTTGFSSPNSRRGRGDVVHAGGSLPSSPFSDSAAAAAYITPTKSYSGRGARGGYLRTSLESSPSTPSSSDTSIRGRGRGTRGRLHRSVESTPVAPATPTAISLTSSGPATYGTPPASSSSSSRGRGGRGQRTDTRSSQEAETSTAGDSSRGGREGGQTRGRERGRGRAGAGRRVSNDRVENNSSPSATDPNSSN